MKHTEKQKDKSIKPEWSKIPLGFLLKRVVQPVNVKKDVLYRQIGMIASHRFPMYCAKNGKLLPEYAYIHFASPRGKYDLNIASPGGAGRNKTLGGEEFKRLKIPVPPVQHQNLAIDIHHTWDRAIKQTEQLIAAKQKLKKGLMQQLLTEQNASTEWRSIRLKGLGCFSKGAGVSKSEIVSQGIPAIRYGELYTTHHIVIRKIRTHISQDSALKSKYIANGDILIAGSGETAEEIGKAAVFLGNDVVCAGGDIVIFSPKSKETDPLFLSYLLNSNIVRRFIQAHAQGQSIVHLYRRDLEKLEILLPPLEEQKKIVCLLNSLEDCINTLASTINLLKEQKRGLMQKLLTGQVRVKA